MFIFAVAQLEAAVVLCTQFITHYIVLIAIVLCYCLWNAQQSVSEINAYIIIIIIILFYKRKIHRIGALNRCIHTL